MSPAPVGAVVPKPANDRRIRSNADLGRAPVDELTAAVDASGRPS